MRIAGVVILLLGLMLGIGSNIEAFVDPPSIIIVVAFGLGALWIADASIGHMVRGIFSKDPRAVDLDAAASGWQLARTASVVVGFVGLLVGMVIMLKSIDDPAALGPGLAIAHLTVFYGLIVGYGFCLPCQYYVESQKRKRP